MRANTMALGGLALLLAASLALPVVAQEEKKAEKQAEEKKAEAGPLPAPTGIPLQPDVVHWGWHEYGMRVGCWGFFEL